MSEPQAHLLVVDDDERIRGLLQKFLIRNGFLVTTGRDAAQARRLLAGLDFDMLILDVMMPGEDGITLTRDLRRRLSVPILLLTAKGETADRISGLEAGADDYLTKPFAPKELAARIRALLRRVRPSKPGHSKLVFGNLEIIPDEGKVLLDNAEVELTKTEFRLLCELANDPGGVFSRELLLDKVWGYGYFGDGRLVDVHIRRLRMKVETDPANPTHVVTVRGLGYRLQS